MERYEDFLMRVSAFEVAEIDLGKSYFRGRASLGDKIDGENRLKPFYGDTVVFDLDEAVKNDGISDPDEDFQKTKCTTFINLSDEANKLMQDLWTQMKSAN